jgi:drug/metabolite transporter (DMT)-like permease
MWLIIAIVASFLQTLRNSFQRNLLANSGVWAATWVRFAFGVPLSVLVLLIFFILRGNFYLPYNPYYLALCTIGAITQVLATAALLKAMQASSFALGATLQHSSLIITAIFGALFLNDDLPFLAWFGVFVASIGMIIASWPKGDLGQDNFAKSAIGGIFGLISGACFAISANSFRAAVLNIAPIPDLFSSTYTVVIVQSLQAIGLGLFLYFFRRKNLYIAIKSWRESLKAGITGASSSIIWFLALALVPAALARAINLLVEVPTSIFIGAKHFREKPNLRKLIAIFMIVCGVLLAILHRF